MFGNVQCHTDQTDAPFTQGREDMSKHPETDLLTAGCSFGPFVESIAEKCRELEVQRNQMFEVLVGIIGTDDPAGLKEARIGVSVAKHLWIRQNVSPAAILDAIQMLSTVKVQRETAGRGLRDE